MLVSTQTGKWHLSKIDDNDYTYPYAVNEVKKCGFDFVDGLYIENIGEKSGEYSDGSFSHNMEFVTHEAIRFINEEDSSPFFLYVNPTVPHSSQSVRTALQEFSCKDTPRNDVTEDFYIEGMTSEYGGSCEDYRASVINRSTNDDELGNIWLDDSVGALLKALEKKGVLENTLFLFQHDHGVKTKSALYENGNRIAQFIHYPSEYQPGTKYDGPVSTIDIAATLLDFAEVSPPYHFMDGTSWRNDVKDMASRNSANNECIFFEMERDRAVRCGCYKYLKIFAQDKEESTTYKKGQKTGHSTDLINLFDLCGGTGNYITDSKDNQEDTNSNLNTVDPSMVRM